LDIVKVEGKSISGQNQFAVFEEHQHKVVRLSSTPLQETLEKTPEQSPDPTASPAINIQETMPADYNNIVKSEIKSYLEEYLSNNSNNPKTAYLEKILENKRKEAQQATALVKKLIIYEEGMALGMIVGKTI